MDLRKESSPLEKKKRLARPHILAKTDFAVFMHLASGQD